jgi:hypothetical protein
VFEEAALTRAQNWTINMRTAKVLGLIFGSTCSAALTAEPVQRLLAELVQSARK